MTLTSNQLPEAASGRQPTLQTQALLRYTNLVHGIAMRQTRGDAAAAADITQAVFLIYLQQRRSLRDERALLAWFLKVTLRTVARAQRDASRRRRREQAAARAEIAMDTDSLVQREQLAQLDGAIARLGRGDRDLILMRYLQGQEFSAIAAAVGANQAVVRQRVTRAVGRLRSKLSGAAQPAPLEPLLALATAHAAPTSVHAAAAAALGGSIAATPTASLAHGVIRLMAIQKLAVPVAVVLSAAICGGLAVALLPSMAQPPPPTPTPSLPHSSLVAATAPATRAATAPATRPDRAAILAQLKDAYGLKDGQAIRLIFPPFPSIRARFWGNRYSSVTFIWLADDHLGTGVAMGEMTFQTIIVELYIPWWQLEDLKAVHWPRGDVDVAFRLSSTPEQRLQELVDIIHQHAGQLLELQQRKETRPCIVVHGPGTRDPFTDQSDHRTVLVMTQAPWGPDQQALYDNKKQNPYPRGTIQTSLSADRPNSEKLDAPFFDEHHFFQAGHVLIARDAVLNHTDPHYAQNLQRVVDNVNKQLGGDWRVEQRQIVIYRFAAAGL